MPTVHNMQTFYLYNMTHNCRLTVLNTILRLIILPFPVLAMIWMISDI